MIVLIDDDFETLSYIKKVSNVSIQWFPTINGAVEFCSAYEKDIEMIYLDMNGVSYGPITEHIERFPDKVTVISSLSRSDSNVLLSLKGARTISDNQKYLNKDDLKQEVERYG